MMLTTGSVYTCLFWLRWRKLRVFSIVLSIHAIMVKSQNSGPFAVEFRCNFDKDFCGMYPTGRNITWTRGQGKTPERAKGGSTGPNKDHTSGKGFYIYINAGSAQAGGIANIKSPWIAPDTEQCLQLEFYYHMYGGNIGTLNVYQETGFNKTELFSHQGQRGPDWNKKVVKLPANICQRRFVFEAIHNNGFYGDIALDDISVLKTNCSKGSGTVLAGQTIIPLQCNTRKDSKQILPLQVDSFNGCDFDTGSCGICASAEVRALWELREASTRHSVWTHVDHSSGNGSYIATNSHFQGNDSKHLYLLTPMLANADIRVLSFYYVYHMYRNGTNIGSITVYRYEEGKIYPLWNDSKITFGNNSTWQVATIRLPTSTGRYRILFEVHLSFNCDISFDDIRVEYKNKTQTETLTTERVINVVSTGTVDYRNIASIRSAIESEENVNLVSSESGEDVVGISVVAALLVILVLITVAVFLKRRFCKVPHSHRRHANTSVQKSDDGAEDLCLHHSVDTGGENVQKTQNEADIRALYSVPNKKHRNEADVTSEIHLIDNDLYGNESVKLNKKSNSIGKEFHETASAKLDAGQDGGGGSDQGHGDVVKIGSNVNVIIADHDIFRCDATADDYDGMQMAIEMVENELYSGH